MSNITDIKPLAYLVFFEHLLGVNQLLLEDDPVVGEFRQHGGHLLLDGHLVLLQDAELVMQGRELGLRLPQAPVQLVPQGQALAQLVQGLRRLADTKQQNSDQMVLPTKHNYNEPGHQIVSLNLLKEHLLYMLFFNLACRIFG